MSIAVRPRRLSARALALALAVGLGGLLVGLSVAPSTLPGDTLHVTRRSAEGASVRLSPPLEEAHHLGLADAARPFATGMLAVAQLPLVLCVFVIPVACYRLGVVLVTRRLPAAGCRGPPQIVIA